METIAIAGHQSSIDFTEARRQAVNQAYDMLNDPVIIAWKNDQTSEYGPEIPGGTEERWHKYADRHEGTLELNVADNFHFIFMEASDFVEPDLNLTSIAEDDGTTILCLDEACTEDDREKIGYFPGGGMGG